MRLHEYTHPNCEIPIDAVRTLERHGFIDRSWHCDTMPHWECGCWEVWIDYTRELSEAVGNDAWFRYRMFRYDSDLGSVGAEPIVQSNDWESFCLYLSVVVHMP